MRLLESKKTDIDAVFLKYGDMLYRVALARLGNEADASDAVQDVFLKYITAPSHFKNSDHEKAWFLRATVNRCHDLARKAKLRVYVPLEDVLDIADDKKDSLNDLLSILSQLSPIYKDVVILHSLEGFSLEETAKILGLSLSAVKMRFSRAKEALQILRKENDGV